MAFKPGESGNPNGRPKGTGGATTNKALAKCLKKHGPEGVSAIAAYLQHYRIEIDNNQKEVEELKQKLSSEEKGGEEYSNIENQISALKLSTENAYENYYKAGGKLADLMQSMVKHEMAPAKGSPKTPESPENPLPVFSTSGI